MRLKTKQDYRVRRHYRVRKKINGTKECPRMSVYVSNKHMYVQLIDDVAGQTLVSVSTLSGDGSGAGVNVEKAEAMGKIAAERAKEQGITKVVFDRGGFRYGKRLSALADAARAGGLEF